ncbi:MAG TPA: universal stress protein [Micropepsaceae bacterium]|nr:universal stress protein [Micropepsaceae bacterium]
MANMKSLLVALDDTPSSQSALNFALALAGQHKARLTGINVLDINWLTRSEPTPMGAGYYKHHADQVRLQRAHEKAEAERKEFLTACSTAHVTGSVILIEGQPVEEVRAAAIAHDAIVIGRDTDFHGDSGDGTPARAVGRILKGLPRPLFVTTEGAHLPKRALIAYDGSNQASHALQLFVLMGLAEGLQLHLVSVHPEAGHAEKTLKSAQAYLHLHGLSVTAHPVISGGDPSDEILTRTSVTGADLLVMGAYGHRGWRETILGSCTSRLLAHARVPMFIYQ